MYEIVLATLLAKFVKIELETNVFFVMVVSHGNTWLLSRLNQLGIIN